jgi:CheY-like chemotaxis protein
MATILVVDDEPIVLALCQRILTLGGYIVLPMSSPEEALKFFRTRQSPTIDLALLDVMMPGMNGIELANQIRSGNPTLKIVLMSGFGPREIARVVGDNPYGMIWKPFKTESLLRMIENVLGGTGVSEPRFEV